MIWFDHIVSGFSVWEDPSRNHGEVLWAIGFTVAWLGLQRSHIPCQCSHSESPWGPSPCRCKSLRDRCLLKTKHDVQSRSDTVSTNSPSSCLSHKKKGGIGLRIACRNPGIERAPCQGLAESFCSAKLNQRGGLMRRWWSDARDRDRRTVKVDSGFVSVAPRWTRFWSWAPIIFNMSFGHFAQNLDCDFTNVWP